MKDEVLQPDGFVQLAASFIEVVRPLTDGPASPENWAVVVGVRADYLRERERARIARERAAYAAGLCNGHGSYGDFSNATCMGCSACEPDEEGEEEEEEERKEASAEEEAPPARPDYRDGEAEGQRQGRERAQELAERWRGMAKGPSWVGVSAVVALVRCAAEIEESFGLETPAPSPSPAPPELDPFIRAASASPSIGALPMVPTASGAYENAPPEDWARHVLRHAEALRAAVEGRRESTPDGERLAPGWCPVRRSSLDRLAKAVREPHEGSSFEAFRQEVLAAWEEVSFSMPRASAAPPPSDLPPYERPRADEGRDAWAARMAEAEKVSKQAPEEPR